MIRQKSVKLVIAVLVFVILSGILFMAAAAPPKQAAAPASGQDLIYPASLFNDGKAHHFKYKTGDGVTVRYFIIRSSDSVIRAAFDACDVCWREDKGYTQKDDFMVCNNCGRRFKSTKINEVSGGCNPAPLARKIENGKVIISVADLTQGKKYFIGGTK